MKFTKYLNLKGSSFKHICSYYFQCLLFIDIAYSCIRLADFSCYNVLQKAVHDVIQIMLVNNNVEVLEVIFSSPFDDMHDT